MKKHLKNNAMWEEGKVPGRGDRTNNKFLTKMLILGNLVQLNELFYIYGVFPAPVEDLVSVSSELAVL